MKNNNGFSFIEMLFAMSIIMMLVATVLPINQLVLTEQYHAKQKLMIQSVLHDNLLDQLELPDVHENIHMIIQHQKVNIEFSNNKGIIKGCATWENNKNKQEKQCLYGLKEK